MGPKGINNRNAAFFVCFWGELGVEKRRMDAIVFYFELQMAEMLCNVA